MTSNNPNTAALNRSRLSGQVVSRGTASGHVFVLPNDISFQELRGLSDVEVERELEAFDSASRIVADQLRSASNEFSNLSDGDGKDIVDAQIAMLSDPSFVEKIRNRINFDRFGSQLAVRIVSDEYFDRLNSLNDRHLKEKVADLQDICDRLLAALSEERPSFEVPIGSVIVCSEIWPSTVLTLAKFKPAAIVSESGGWTSHSYILARELGIPCISGVSGVTKRLSNGELVYVDAIKGSVLIDHVPENVNPTTTSVTTDRDVPALTDVCFSDGTVLEFLANVDSLENCRNAIAAGVTEIGLVRSEYLFELESLLPDESIQYTAYREIADAANGRNVSIRTFDVSVGRIISNSRRREHNPALGMRSIRLSFRYERQFRAQLRSLIRANHGRNVSILVPMVPGASDIVRFRSLLQQEFEILFQSDPSTMLPSVGAMIELPSAVLTIDDVLEVVDFVCVGTNDLVQYTLGVDRDNGAVADWYQTLHPAILRSLKLVVDAAVKVGKPVTVCGEAAGSPFYLPLLIGLGVRRFSMNTSSIASLSRYALHLSRSECSELAEKMLLSTNTRENESTLTEFCRNIWPDLKDERVNFPPKNL